MINGEGVMKLILGAMLIASGVFFLCIVMLAARNPRRPFWATDQWVGYCHSVVILELFAFGLFTMAPDLYRLATEGAVDRFGLLVSAGILIATVVGVKALKMKPRLAALDAETARLEKVRPFPATSQGDAALQGCCPDKAA